MKCSTALHCLTCSNSYSCDSCNTTAFYKLDNDKCVIECDKKFSTSGCRECDENTCLVCTEKKCCVGLLKRYWNNTSNKCVDPAVVFGEGCLESDGEVCTVCTAQTCCESGKYYDDSRRKCVKCSSVLKCVECSNGYSCDTCNETEFYKFENGKCVVDCDRKFNISGCSLCSEKKCLECSEKKCCGEQLKRYWNSTASVCVDPSEALGEGCLESDGEKCTHCTAQTCCGYSEYYDALSVTCKPCSNFGATCSKCTKGGCTDCGSNEGITVGADGQCTNCSSVHGVGCQQCGPDNCTKAEDGYTVVGLRAMKCSDLFGNCSRCDANGCTACSDNLVSIAGFCRSCKDMFGENCTSCDADKCTSCAAVPSISLVNGACVNCEQAYGEGCTRCGNITGCEGHKQGYFVSKQFSLSCEVLKEMPGGLYDRCMAEPANRRSLAARDGNGTLPVPSTEIDIDYNGENVTIKCSDMTANCSECIDDNGQAKCTKCHSGYILVGWTCLSCSDQFPDGNCLECNSAGCTSCVEKSMNVANNGKCITCEEGKQVFSQTSKTCVDCATMFSRCSTCNKDKCLSCEQPYIYDGDSGTCSTCSKLHGTGCSDCNTTHCLRCMDDACCDDGEQIIATNGLENATCGTCSMVDENCIECTSEECIKCKDDTMFIENGKCVKCSDTFEECGHCTPDMCTMCINTNSSEMILTYDGCYPNDTIVEEEEEDKSSSFMSLLSSVHSSKSSLPSSSSKPSQPVVVPSTAASPANDKSEGGGNSKTGMIVGIVVGGLALIALVGVAVYCVVIKKAKHDEVADPEQAAYPDLFEDDAVVVSMSDL